MNIKQISIDPPFCAQSIRFIVAVDARIIYRSYCLTAQIGRIYHNYNTDAVVAVTKVQCHFVAITNELQSIQHRFSLD